MSEFCWVNQACSDAHFKFKAVWLKQLWALIFSFHKPIFRKADSLFRQLIRVMFTTNFTSSKGVCMELILASYLQNFTERITPSQTLRVSFCLQGHSGCSFSTLLPDHRRECQRFSFPEHTEGCSWDVGDRQEPEWGLQHTQQTCSKPGARSGGILRTQCFSFFQQACQAPLPGKMALKSLSLYKVWWQKSPLWTTFRILTSSFFFMHSIRMTNSWWAWFLL